MPRLSVLFKSWDENSDGYIDYEEFVNCLFTCQEQLYLADPTSLEYIYTREEFDELARTIDQAKTGRINYLSFLGLFSSAESATIVTQGNEKVSPLLSRTSAATSEWSFMPRPGGPPSEPPKPTCRSGARAHAHT